MTARLPHVLVGSRRPLSTIARPAGGRARSRAVRTRVVWTGLAWLAEQQAAHELAAMVGPARCAPVEIETCLTLTTAASVLARGELALSEERITIVLAGYEAALATFGRWQAALVVVHCPVLWPQVETSPRWMSS